MQRGVHVIRGLRAGRVSNKGSDGRSPSKGVTAATAGDEVIAVSMEGMHRRPSKSNSGSLKQGIVPGKGFDSIGGFGAVDMTIT